MLHRKCGITWTMHDFSRTCSSVSHAVDRGIGELLLLHAPHSVTERSDLNACWNSAPLSTRWKFRTHSAMGCMVLRALKDTSRAILRSNDFAAHFFEGPGSCRKATTRFV